MPYIGFRTREIESIQTVFGPAALRLQHAKKVGMCASLAVRKRQSAGFSQEQQ